LRPSWNAKGSVWEPGFVGGEQKRQDNGCNILI